MSTTAKPDLPGKTCKVCGKPLTRKRYNGKIETYSRYVAREHCDQSCANTRSEVTKDAEHWRARRHRADRCANCGTVEELHVHHIDRIPSNNDPAHWTTAPIPAYALREGDRVDQDGYAVPILCVRRDGPVIRAGDVTGGFTVDAHAPVTVHVPDEPVDGYNLWKPTPHTFMDGCVCVHRHDPQHPHNWEAAGRASDCRAHNDRFNDED